MRRKQQNLGKKKEKRRRGDVLRKRNASKSEKMTFLHSRFRGYGNGRKWLQSKKKWTYKVSQRSGIFLVCFNAKMYTNCAGENKTVMSLS